MDDGEIGRVLTLGGPHGAGALVLPARELDPAAVMNRSGLGEGRSIDLANGAHDPATLTGPTLVLPGVLAGGRNA